MVLQFLQTFNYIDSIFHTFTVTLSTTFMLLHFFKLLTFLMMNDVWCCYMLLHVVTCCCMLLHVVACCCMLLHVVTCCCMLLHVVACCYMLLHVVTCLMMFDDVWWCYWWWMMMKKTNLPEYFSNISILSTEMTPEVTCRSPRTCCTTALKKVVLKKKWNIQFLLKSQQSVEKYEI